MPKISAVVEGELLERFETVETFLRRAGLRAGSRGVKLPKEQLVLQAIREWVARMELNLKDRDWTPSISSENKALQETETALLSLNMEARKQYLSLVLPLARALRRPNGGKVVFTALREALSRESERGIGSA